MDEIDGEIGKPEEEGGSGCARRGGRGGAESSRVVCSRGTFKPDGGELQCIGMQVSGIACAGRAREEYPGSAAKRVRRKERVKDRQISQCSPPLQGSRVQASETGRGIDNTVALAFDCAPALLCFFSPFAVLAGARPCPPARAHRSTHENTM
jgi:hypothetical protein